MHLTPEDIVNQELKTGLRGYVVADVDALLDRLADQVEHTDAELARLRDELASLQAQVDEAARHEAAVSRTLVTAQETAERTEREAREEADRVEAAAVQEAERIRAEARREADDLVASARGEAERVRSDAAQERAALRDRIAHLLEAETTHRDQLRRHLQEHLARLDGLQPGPAHAALDELDDLERDADALPGSVEAAPTPATHPDAAKAEELFRDAAHAAEHGEPTGPPLTVRVRDDIDAEEPHHDDQVAGADHDPSDGGAADEVSEDGAGSAVDGGQEETART